MITADKLGPDGNFMLYNYKGEEFDPLDIKGKCLKNAQGEILLK